MSGIAGIFEASGPPPSDATLRGLGAAMRHRGPDGEAVLSRGGLGLTVRRLALVDPQAADILPANEAQTVFVAFHGMLTNAPQLRAELEARGHRLASGEDAALLPHLWEEHQEGMLDRLKGQFAFALWDDRQQRLLLARDRFGICPLHWSRQADRLVFASEIKALLAAGLVEPRVDPRGISQIFTCFGLPGPVTCFEGVSALLPGHYLDVRRRSTSSGATLEVRDHTWWQMDFPDRGSERQEDDAEKLLAELEQVMLRSIERRLRADVPVVAYSSGGLDSSLLVTMARRIQDKPLTTFTFRLASPGGDETKEADIVAQHVGSKTIPIPIDGAGLLAAYPRLVQAAESPVVDTSAAALLLLAAGVHQHGYKAVLTGEGSDEWLAGYPWFRIDKKVELLNFVPGVRFSRPGFRLFETLLGIPRLPRARETAMYSAVGGHNAWMYAYFLMSSNQLRFFSESMLQRLGDYVPLAELGLNDRMPKWNALNRSLYIGARVHLTGLHLNARGDRSTMHSSLQSRFPFLDEEVFGFLAGLGTEWKMRGYQDKTILRLLAERWLPPELTRGRKRLIHAPLYNFHHAPKPAWMEQLLSPESLSKTGYFDAASVAHWRGAVKTMREGYAKLFVEMGLVGVISTQLWHHLYIDPALCELPGDTLAATAVA